MGFQKTRRPVLVEDGNQFIAMAASDETTTLTTGDGKITIRSPGVFKVRKVRASLVTASATGAVTIAIRIDGVDMFSTNLTIDESEKTSESAATPAVLTTLSIPDDAEIAIDIDGAGATAAGLKIYILGSFA
jgi:hypothetical protein